MYFLKLLECATDANLHLILLKIYTKECFFYKNINKSLRKEESKALTNLFPCYFLL